MKVLFAVALLAVAAVATIEDQFGAWKAAHKRTYTGEENTRRLENFRINYARVMELNAAEAHIPNGATFKLNDFADWSASELKRLRGVRGAHPSWRNQTNTAVVTGIAPASVDWRTKGVVAPIQNQGQCGSCWAFSATACLESQAAIKNGGGPRKLAEQFLVDCDHQCGTYRQESGCDSGCNGGLMPSAWIYTKSKGGQPSESSYPYTARNGACRSGETPITDLTSWEFAPEDEGGIATYVANNGPVSVAVDAANWSFYRGGIMSSNSICPRGAGWNTLDHGVVIVGYGEESGMDFWIIRNSWATSWGEEGYCRILRGQGFCGVQLFACRAIV